MAVARAGVELVGPAGDDALDVGVGLPADALHRARPGHAAQARPPCRRC